MEVYQSGAESVADAIREQDGRAESAMLGVSDAAQVEALIQQTADCYGRLDYMFNIADIAMLGEVLDMEPAAYATTKHAVVGLTTLLHYEAQAYGVHITCVCLGIVETGIFERMDVIKIACDAKKNPLS